MGDVLAVIGGIYVCVAVGSAIYRLVKTKAPGTQVEVPADKSTKSTV